MLKNRKWLIILLLIVIISTSIISFMKSNIIEKYRSNKYVSTGFSSKTNSTLRMVLTDSVFTKDDVIALSYSFEDGYHYLLNILNKKELLFNEISSEQVVAFINSVFYTDSGMHCMDSNLLEEIVLSIIGDEELSFENVSSFNQYNNSFCLEKPKANKYKINYDYSEELDDSIVIHYSLKNYKYNQLDVYFKQDNSKYLLHKIVVK